MVFFLDVKSSVSFVINGKCVYAECDMYYGFGDGIRYFTIGVAFDNGLWLPNAGDLWIYPACGEAMAIGDVTTIINNNTIDVSTETAYRESLRSTLSNDESWNVWSSNFEIDFPIIIEVINDDGNGEVEVLFTNHAGSVQSCTFIGSFASDEELYFNAINDYYFNSPNPSEELIIYYIDITTTIPTPAPTIEPTIEPTTNPTTNPTIDPTGEPTKDPTADSTANPTADPSADPTPISGQHWFFLCLCLHFR